MQITIKKITEFLSNHWLIIVVALIGLAFRIVQPQERFLYGHDQDLSAWFVKDVTQNKHLRLIGQETSTRGIFIGPLFYYLLIPFYFLFGMDPIGGVYLVTLLGISTIISVYFVVSRIFSKNAGIIASVIYSLSYYTIANDREVVPTMPVILWTVWFLYGINLIFQKKIKQAFILLGVLTGLIWHINFALVLPLPLILIALIMTKYKPRLSHLINAFIAFFIPAVPLFLFELRHNFPQTKALFVSLTTDQQDVINGIDKLERVIFLMSKNAHSLFIGSYPGISYKPVFYLIVLILLFLFIKKIINKKWTAILFLWLIFYVSFFSFYSKIVSEYYLNGTIIIFIILVSILLSVIIKNEKIRHFGFIFIGLFIVFNVNRFVTTPINKSGYLERKEIIKEIDRDARERGYSCVAISYITDPGYNLGYRYFIYQTNLKLRPISMKIPVYTIVYPLKPIFPENATRGAIGLIYPDYKVYNFEEVGKECHNADINITEPLWGFP